jgi:hypothetical protein
VDATAPSLRLATAGTALRAALRSGVRLRVTTNERGTVSVTLRVDAATARKLGLKRTGRTPVKVGALRATVRSGASTVTTRFSAKARRAMRNARSVTVSATVVITDGSGNRTTRRMTLKLRR